MSVLQLHIQKKDSRGKQLDVRHRANVLQLRICQGHWGRMLTGLQSQQHVQDSEPEEMRK